MEENRARYDLQIYKGATYRKTAWFKQNGKPFDLTGYTAAAQIRPSVNSDILTSDIACEIDLAAAAVSLGLSAEQTALLPAGIQEWDLKMIDQNGNVAYYVYGKVFITGRVTE